MKTFTVEFLTKSGKLTKVDVVAAGAAGAAVLVRDRVDCEEVLDVDHKLEATSETASAGVLYGIGKWPATLGELFSES